jgi:predicted branched-subunit amino acid permease
LSSTDNLSIQAERRAIRREALIAVRPALIATFTWGLVTGVAMVKSGLTETAAVAMTLLVYAGSAQLTSLPLIAAGAPLWLIFAAGLIVNLRFLAHWEISSFNFRKMILIPNSCNGFNNHSYFRPLK